MEKAVKNSDLDQNTAQYLKGVYMSETVKKPR